MCAAQVVDVPGRREVLRLPVVRARRIRREADRPVGAVPAVGVKSCGFVPVPVARSVQFAFSRVKVIFPPAAAPAGESIDAYVGFGPPVPGLGRSVGERGVVLTGCPKSTGGATAAVSKAGVTGRTSKHSPAEESVAPAVKPGVVEEFTTPAVPADRRSHRITTSEVAVEVALLRSWCRPHATGRAQAREVIGPQMKNLIEPVKDVPVTLRTAESVTWTDTGPDRDVRDSVANVAVGQGRAGAVRGRGRQTRRARAEPAEHEVGQRRGHRVRRAGLGHERRRSTSSPKPSAVRLMPPSMNVGDAELRGRGRRGPLVPPLLSLARYGHGDVTRNWLEVAQKLSLSPHRRDRRIVLSAHPEPACRTPVWHRRRSGPGSWRRFRLRPPTRRSGCSVPCRPPGSR